MDWKEIIKKYPKAFEKYSLFKYPEWKSIVTFAELVITVQHNQFRDLYDFFDKNKLIVEIMWTGNYASGGKLVFTYKIGGTKSNYTYNTRQNAEVNAFTKAFEILEERLKNENEQSN